MALTIISRIPGRLNLKLTGYKNRTTCGLKSPKKGWTLVLLPSSWNTKKVSFMTNSIFLADGTNIDNWTFDEIKEVVAEFVADCAAQKHNP